MAVTGGTALPGRGGLTRPPSPAGGQRPERPPQTDANGQSQLPTPSPRFGGWRLRGLLAAALWRGRDHQGEKASLVTRVPAARML